MSLGARSALAVVLVLGGCATSAPTVTSTPAASSPAVATPTTAAPTAALVTVAPIRVTPEPPGTPAEDSMPTSASVERDGIRLTIALGANPLRAGSIAYLHVTIENLGHTQLAWTNDGCDTNAWIDATVAADWRESTTEFPPDIRPYRDWLREQAAVDEPIRLVFERGSRGRFSGCADVGLPRALAPGAKATQLFEWDGFAAPRLGRPPSAPATVSAVFERWSRGGEADEGRAIRASLDSWILAGRPGEMLSPAEAIDAALGDQRLASWLLTRPLHQSADAIAEYDNDLGLWAVGLLMYPVGGDPVLHAAFLDPVSGEVIAIREHRVGF